MQREREILNLNSTINYLVFFFLIRFSLSFFFRSRLKQKQKEEKNCWIFCISIVEETDVNPNVNEILLKALTCQNNFVCFVWRLCNGVGILVTAVHGFELFNFVFYFFPFYFSLNLIKFVIKKECAKKKIIFSI